MDHLTDIADRARTLAKFAPDSAREMLRELRALEFYPDDKHAYREFKSNCDEAFGLMNELVNLVYQHLPELPTLEYVRILPQWRFDDPATDWPAIVAELRQIEDAAKRKLLHVPASQLASSKTVEVVSSANISVVFSGQRPTPLIEKLAHAMPARGNKSEAAVAREICGSKAKSALSQLRRLKRGGRITFVESSTVSALTPQR